MAIKGPEELPIFSHREKILQHIRTHRVTHIQGETGCGKSTQVPKYIMEDAAKEQKEGRGSGRTKIVVTQPRRMAAITLARRVASELDEDIGKTVGYKISGDSVSGKLCFATTGFLLQVLVNNPEEFGTYTHVILDEVHERSVDADLLTMLMKLLMQCYPEVKLIVMSATLQAKLFAEYFEQLESEYLSTGRRPRGKQPPKLKVEPIFVGVRTYPVEEIFLDELDTHFEIAGGFARMGIDKALRGFSGMGKGGKGGKGKGGSASGFKRLEPQITEGFDELCRDLVQQMAREQCTLIVFLPGIADITAFYETLAPLDTSRRNTWSNSWREEDEPVVVASTSGKISLKIYPMHSLIPREEQEEVFNEPPKGVCHVVLASNIAESSLTLPSVCGIIDLAMRRSIQYDARRLMSCLVTTWCSQSSCKQRAGRAGRTMPGRAVRLVTRSFFEREMVAFDPPEMLNAPLTKLYLQAKQLCAKLDNLWNEGVIPEGLDMDLSTPTLLLGEVVQPPSVALVQAAITELGDVGCIDSPSEDASITPLGYLAMALPCELRLCRLLYMGLLMQCPCDAIAMVAGLTAADPFSTPSLLVLKDEREYCKKLERSFAARRWCDRGRFSEPLMLRDIFAEWVQAGAPRGFRAMGGFARDWSIIPKKFEALTSEAVDLCARISKLLNPRSSGYQSIQRLLATMRFSVDRREDLVRSGFPADAEYKKLFSEDVGLMRGLLCAAFSDQMLLQLKPRWAPSSGQKKRKEEQMVEIMKKQDLNLSGSVCFLNPPQELRHGDADENHQLLCEAMCGERAARIYWDEREKLLFYDFKLRRKAKFPEAHVEPGYDPCPVIQDVVPQVHRLHQFGAGRYKFTVESPLELYHDEWGDREESNAKPTLELFKPLQPFLINWEVVQHTSLSEGSKKSAKKPASVKAMPDWRNPLGFACNARSDLPAEELFGVCASVQGLEAGGSAFVAGATALGLNYLPLLLTTMDPRKWDLQWGFDPQTGEVRAIKIMHFEIILPPDTLTEDVIWKINAIRSKILESLTPWEEEEEVRPRRKGKGKGKGYNSPGSWIWVEDVAAEMHELLEEIWPTPDPVQRPKKLAYCSAIGEAVSDVLEPLQPLAEEMDYTAAQSGNSTKEKGKKSKQSKGSQAAEDWMHHISSRQGVSADDAKAVIDLINYLWKQPSHEGKLSALCGRFPTKKKTIQKFPEYLECTAVNSSKTEFIVRAIGANGWSGQNGKQDRAAGKAKASRDTGARDRPSAAERSNRTWTSGSAVSGSGKGAHVEARIERLCNGKDMACQASDFDNRVRSWIRRFEARRGTQNMELAFEVLGEWCSKKERDQVRNWPSYLMVLLRNWERNTFEEEVAD